VRLSAWLRPAVAIAMVALLAGCGSSGGGASTTGQMGGPALTLGLNTYPPDERAVLPAISGPTLAGPTLDLHSLRGSVVVLNVWASWCAQCRSESPALARLAADPRLARVRFVGIDEEDRPEAARSFAAAVGAGYPHLVDPDGSLLARIPLVPSTAIPSTVVIDQEGRVAARVIGAVDPAALRKELLMLQRSG
jgi:thiol-disulfide isomerase/thioredoxin